MMITLSTGTLADGRLRLPGVTRTEWQWIPRCMSRTRPSIQARACAMFASRLIYASSHLPGKPIMIRYRRKGGGSGCRPMAQQNTTVSSELSARLRCMTRYASSARRSTRHSYSLTRPGWNIYLELSAAWAHRPCRAWCSPSGNTQPAHQPRLTPVFGAYARRAFRAVCVRVVQPLQSPAEVEKNALPSSLYCDGWWLYYASSILNHPSADDPKRLCTATGESGHLRPRLSGFHRAYAPPA